MSDGNKRKPSSDATMQVDLDQVQLSDLDGILASKGIGRKGPPALPASVAAPPPLPTNAPPRNSVKTVGYVVMFVVLLAIAIAGGLAVGRRAGATSTAATTATGPTTTGTASLAPTANASASAAKKTLTLPTIEIR